MMTKYNRNSKALVASLVLLFLMGCTSISLLSNIPQVADNKAIGKVYVGPFIDMRNFPGFDTKVLGTRCGQGNMFCRKDADERDADEFVKEHLINAARASSLFADRAPDDLVDYKNDTWIINRSTAIQNDKLILVGFISKLEYFEGSGASVLGPRYMANLDIDINLTLLDPNDGRYLWSSRLNISKKGNFKSLGLIRGSDTFKGWLAKNLQDEALTIFSSDEFRNVIKK